MDNSLTAYDTSVGTKIDAFEPGKTYSGVVILVKDGGNASVSLELGSSELSGLGIEPFIDEDGDLSISLAGLLDALDADLSYDEETSTITLNDESGVLGLLLNLFGS